MISFSDTFTKVEECFKKPDIASTLTPNLESVTIIRDVYGKIRLFLEPKANFPPEQTDIDKLGQYLRENLFSYYGEDIWLPQGNKDGYKALIDVIKNQRIEAEWNDDTIAIERDDEDPSPRLYILERHIAKHTWTNENSGNLPWKIQLVYQEHKPAIVTFFSFKGGVGRTTALVATALTLARNGYRVAIVDLDLEAPGLSSIFSPNNPKPFGVIDYLLEKKIQSRNWSLRDHILPINNPLLLGNSGGQIHLFTAGNVDSNYLEKLARLDFQNLVDHQLPETFKGMLKELESAVKPLDFILLDSRAGFHDIGGLALTDLSHAAVIFGRQSRQSWAGLTHVIRRLSRPLSEDREQLPVVLVHAMALASLERRRNEELRAFKEQAYIAFQENYYYEGEVVPNPDDINEPFSPIILPLKDELQGDISLFIRDESQEESDRLRQLVALMTNEDYQKIAERLCIRFNKRFNQTEEEVI
ncbi:AAA family ATPase [Dolichospermum sp. ST_con]|nr:AAA family ATPase [Dolichospermum sp. ST_con]MDD1420748.1 AAA family ATPase [Dolichospermum sp. ST_sed1]MDD1426319.1 AAA family ATPase [Dolichospermum sp. ST_sed9]MDD1433374.1 AAA family ATPase [Dolichospermum sp. ST_sed6]MDD1436215.1 AAA family ATPase [Dolichospermum sp. ST_sed10]MDD1442280.1 AAA family ATPase [Dolichospermum sp. ST_sed3]MDD1447897.1 AAA family ATPase [Dolichospermum sp. ST_sed8]MDD1456376.1 AAA family ATPase [Dolichospermum sp. ST_sed7]MDD1461897.1 AAA family ATPase [D